MDTSNEHMCRVCLDIIQNNFESIFIRRSELSPLGLLYKELFDLPIKFGLEHPKYICQNCSQKLRQFNDFKSKAYESYAKFMKIVKSHTYDEPVENVIIFECKLEDETAQGIKIEYEEMPDVDEPPGEDINSGSDPLSFHKPEKPEDSTELIIEDMKEYTDIEYLDDSESKSEEVTNIDHITLAEDILLHAGRHQCASCNKTFRTFRDMKNHRRDDHKFTRQKCPLCPKVSVKPSSFVGHLKVHGEEASSYITEAELVGKEDEALKTNEGDIRRIRHKCKDCIETFRTESEMKAHRRGVHNASRKICPQCPRTFVKQDLLEAHLKLHQCDVIVEDMDELVIVRQVVDTASAAGGEAIAYDKSVGSKQLGNDSDKALIHKCLYCPETFMTQMDLHTHRKNTHKLIRRKCPECPKSFVKLQSLERHIRTRHGVALYECDECHRKFRFKSAYLLHLRIHRKEKAHQCHLCGKQFITQHDLNIHFRCHTNERPYECDICGQRFRMHSHCKYHRLNHFDKKLPCSICDKKFGTPPALNKHVKKVHMNIRQHKCHICEKYFKSKWFMGVHIKKQHQMK